MKFPRTDGVQSLRMLLKEHLETCKSCSFTIKNWNISSFLDINFKKIAPKVENDMDEDEIIVQTSKQQSLLMLLATDSSQGSNRERCDITMVGKGDPKWNKTGKIGCWFITAIFLHKAWIPSNCTYCSSAIDPSGSKVDGSTARMGFSSNSMICFLNAFYR